MKKVIIGLLIGLIGVVIFVLGDLVIPTFISLRISEYQSKIFENQKRNNFDKAILIMSKIRGPSTEDIQVTVNTVSEEVKPVVTKYDYDDDVVLIGRFLPIKVIIEKYTSRYNVNILWYCQTLFEESNIDPVAYNPDTKDYGISQEKKATFEEARTLALDKTNIYYSGVDLPDNIYNPESNIISSLIFVRSKLINEFKIPIGNEKLLSAVYNLGYNAITPNGELSNGSITYINLVESRKSIVKRIFEYFKSSENQNKSIKELLSLYNPDLTPRQMYHVVFSYYLSKLTDDVTLWSGAIVLSESLNYFKILDEGYGEQNRDSFEKIYQFYLKFKTKMVEVQDRHLASFFSNIGVQIELTRSELQ